MEPWKLSFPTWVTWIIATMANLYWVKSMLFFSRSGSLILTSADILIYILLFMGRSLSLGSCLLCDSSTLPKQLIFIHNQRSFRDMLSLTVSYLQDIFGFFFDLYIKLVIFDLRTYLNRIFCVFAAVFWTERTALIQMLLQICILSACVKLIPTACPSPASLMWLT